MWLLRFVGFLVMFALCALAVWFGIHAFDVPTLPAVYGLVGLVAFVLTGGIVYWVERYR